MPLNKRSNNIHSQLEKQVLDHSDEIIVTSQATKTEFETKTKTPITLITNGHDLEPNSSQQPEGKFIISHVGTMLSRRNPIALWKALRMMLNQDPDFHNDLEVQLSGNVSQAIVDSIDQYELGEWVRMSGYIDHDEAVHQMYHSQVLLLIEIDSPETREILPGKFFEYLASRRPVLGIGPENSVVEQLLAETQAGRYFLHEHTDGVFKFLQEIYQKYLMGALTGNDSDISRFHRKHLTGKLAETIQKWA
jgi:glycosyltransferase involved in cell wall biosynthesis